MEANPATVSREFLDHLLGGDRIIVPGIKADDTEEQIREKEDLVRRMLKGKRSNIERPTVQEP